MNGNVQQHLSCSPLPPPAAPLAYEPFSTLAMIYEDEGDVDKALQFSLIAAHLNPSDCEEWIRLAEISLEQDNIRQALVCYSKGQSVHLESQFVLFVSLSRQSHTLDF